MPDIVRKYRTNLRR